MHNFRELRIWQKSMEVVKEVYIETKTLPATEQYGLISQIQRSAVSIPSNIAEGSGRTNKDFKRFLSIALSSCFELETQLILCKELNYLKENIINKIQAELQEIQKMIYNFQKSLKVN
jgi:four helix bundle protein